MVHVSTVPVGQDPQAAIGLGRRTAPAVIRVWALQMLGTEPGGCARRRLNLRFTGSNLVRLRRERAMTLTVFAVACPSAVAVAAPSGSASPDRCARLAMFANGHEFEVPARMAV